jgi:hypothetical protein
VNLFYTYGRGFLCQIIWILILDRMEITKAAFICYPCFRYAWQISDIILTWGERAKKTIIKRGKCYIVKGS